ncbi:MAG: hypothetical protein GY870_15015 [archaeon]|nr:hypothetical protein [archaeon]
MAKATDYLSTVLSNIEALGYKHSKEIFDFETVPSSRLMKAYRFELITDGIEELSGSSVDKTKRLDLWFAFKMKASKDIVKTELINVYDLQETIEDTLLKSLVNIDSGVPSSLISEFTEDGHLIIQLQFDYTYRRDL